MRPVVVKLIIVIKGDNDDEKVLEFLATAESKEGMLREILEVILKNKMEPLEVKYVYNV